ncbi:MAG TPA: hypothetical protein VGF17_24525 [Phytomonospora sp.]
MRRTLVGVLTVVVALAGCGSSEVTASELDAYMASQGKPLSGVSAAEWLDSVKTVCGATNQDRVKFASSMVGHEGSLEQMLTAMGKVCPDEEAGLRTTYDILKGSK